MRLKVEVLILKVLNLYHLRFANGRSRKLPEIKSKLRELSSASETLA